MKKIYIVDAVNYLFRSYYAIREMTSPSGESTHALYGFIRSLLKLTELFSPTHLVCVFDGPDNKKSRHAVYAEYKMHRKKAPDDLFAQFEGAYEYCRLAKIPTLCVEGVEADDAMAAVALWAKKQGAQAFLCSSDKDLMQLVDADIFLLQPHKDYALVDSGRVEEIYGVRPDQMLDFLALMGDASDNIPGIEGFGAKTTAQLLQKFQTLDALLEHPEKVSGEKKQKALREQKDQALMSRELARLQTDIVIPQEEVFYHLSPPDPQDLEPFFREKGFLSLLKDLSPSETPPPSLPKKYHLVQTLPELQALFQRLPKEPRVAIDTETTNLHPLSATLVGIGFAVTAGEAWYVPFNGPLERSQVLTLCQEFFSQTKSAFFGHHLKFDWHILQQAGIPLHRIGFDTLLASYLLEPQKRHHNLDDLSLEILHLQKVPITDLIGKGKAQITMDQVPLEQIKEYCCEDVDYTLRLRLHFEEELQKRGLMELLETIDLPLLPVLARMERAGIYLDAEELSQFGVTLRHSLTQIQEEIFQEAGETFNLNSPKQLSAILYEKLQLPLPRKKQSAFSTSASVLEHLAQKHPIAQKLLQYRTLEKLRSTYVEALPETIHPRTGRIHCTFHQSVTATGRLSCQNPNLQNIPVRKEGLAIRKCFKPQGSDCYFLGADYSQIELRLLAHFSEDPSLMSAFEKGKDIHTHTASLIFQIPECDISSEMRAKAKAVNFGIVYGQGPFGLSEQLSIPIKEAAEFIETYFARYPKVASFLEESKETCRKTGIAVTLTGRQRPLADIHSQNPNLRHAAERLAVNTPLQGTAADMIKIAMIQIAKELEERSLSSQMILQIHDELIFEVPEKELPILQSLVKEKMESALSLKVPLVVDMAVGKNWAEC